MKLYCIECGNLIKKRDTIYKCSSCAGLWPTYKNYIPDFRRTTRLNSSLSPILDLLINSVKESKCDNWNDLLDGTLKGFSGNYSDRIGSTCCEGLGGYLIFLSSISSKSKILVYPSPFDASILHYSKYVKEIYVCDPVPEILYFNSMRAKENNINNIKFICINGQNGFPFQKDYFDLILLNATQIIARKDVSIILLIKKLIKLLNKSGEILITLDNLYYYCIKGFLNYFSSGFKNERTQILDIFQNAKKNNIKIINKKKLLNYLMREGFEKTITYKLFPNSENPTGFKPINKRNNDKYTKKRIFNLLVRKVVENTNFVDLKSRAFCFNLCRGKSTNFVEKLLYSVNIYPVRIKSYQVAMKGSVTVEVEYSNSIYGKINLVLATTEIAEKLAKQNLIITKEIVENKELPTSVKDKVSNILLSGIYEGLNFFISYWIPGVDCRKVINNDLKIDHVVLQVFNFLKKLSDTKYKIIKGKRSLNIYLDNYQMRVEKLCDRKDDIKRLEKVKKLITKGLYCYPLRISYTHGDLVLRNIIIDKSTLELKGIIDWEHGSFNQLEILNYFQLLVSIIREKNQIETGSLVVKILKNEFDSKWLKNKLKKVIRIQDNYNDLLHSLILLFWIQRIDMMSYFYDKPYQKKWKYINFYQVLDNIEL